MPASPATTNIAGRGPAPSQQTLLDTNVPAHIPTWAFDEYYGQGESVSSATVQQYVTYAEGGVGNTKAVTDCSGSAKNCSSVFYLESNLVYANPACPNAQTVQMMAQASESWYVHETGHSDSAHRAHGSYPSSCKGKNVTVPVYLANNANPGVQAFFSSYLQTNGDAWDYYFMDDTKDKVLTQAYGPGGGFCPDIASNHYCLTTPEYPTDASVLAAHASFANAMNHRNGSAMKFFFNGIGFSGNNPINLDQFQASNRFVGGLCEDCIVNAGALRPTMYAKVLTAMALIDAIPGAQFVELNTGFSAAGSTAQISQRLVTTAIAWLGYSDGHTVVFADLEDNTKNLAAWAEDGIYPSQPLQSMTTSSANIMVAPGVFRREFAACYNAGVAIGPCAALLNANAKSVTVSSAWLSQSYGHVVNLHGGDISHGGTVQLTSVAFKANSTTIPGSQAILLAP
jgi:hypothetical protein